MKFPLMYNNITKEDLNSIISFLKTNPILTASKKVLEFEKKWSKWLGVKYSIFVNSGSSANYLTFLALKINLKKNTKKKEVIVPTLTWNSDIVSVIQNGFKPVFVDIDLKNLCMNEEKLIKSISKNTFAVFLSHIQGFNGLSKNLLNILKKKKILLIEDVCESHGATFNKKKLGSFGYASNFSFYYAHHLSTIEGGMICTNDYNFYQMCRMVRAHGLLRESNDLRFKQNVTKKYKNLSPNFIFMYPAFNMRSNEISAVLGINQLKRLDKGIRKRNINFKTFLKHIDKNYFFTNFDTEGCSNYAFPLILKNKSIKLRDKLENLMTKNNIEFRRGNAGGGNQLRQPYLKAYVNEKKIKKFTSVEHMHFFGYYVGNFPDLSKSKIIKLCKILNNIKNEKI